MEHPPFLKKTMILFLVLFILITLSHVTLASGQDNSCIDLSVTDLEVNSCGAKLVPIREANVDSEFSRLSNKFKNNENMQTMIQLTRKTWDNYRNIQCAFESAAAVGGQTKGPLPVKGNKALLRCMVRTLDEMKSALEAFQ